MTGQMSAAEINFRRTTMPESLAGLDADLYAALAECGRIIEAIPCDERKQRVAAFLDKQGMQMDEHARNFVTGVMLAAHQRRVFDMIWEDDARRLSS